MKRSHDLPCTGHLRLSGKRGAVSVVNLELSAAYDAEARELIREAGIDESRGTWRLHDTAEDPDGVEPADVVVLPRVVCCYPDYERLLSAAAARAERLLSVQPSRRGMWRRARSSAFRASASGSAAGSPPTPARRHGRECARLARRPRHHLPPPARSDGPRRQDLPGGRP